MQAVILAGGLGTRMRPFTEQAPKYLLPVCGRSFADYQLGLLKQDGVRDIVLCVGHLGEMIQAHLGDGASRGVHIEYSWDAPSSGGTAGALKKADALLEDTFFLTWGDSYVRVDHAAMFAGHQANALEVICTMGVFRNENAWDRSNVRVEGDKVACYEKSSQATEFTHIDAGISVFSRRALAEIPSEQTVQLDGFFSNWAKTGRLGAYPVSQRFYEVGSPGGLADFERFIGEHGSPLHE